MKLPRWLVIAMLTTSVLAVLAAAGWWWVTWPERTAREFHFLICEGRYQAAGQMCVPARTITEPVNENQKEIWLNPRLVPDGSRTLSDLILGRRDFAIVSEKSKYPIDFTCERGAVILVH